MQHPDLAPGPRIAQIAVDHAGCSARGPSPSDVDRYAELLIRPSDPATPAARAYYLANPSPQFSTCGLTVLGCWRLAGCLEPEVTSAYYPGRIGRAFADMEAVAMRCGAWEPGLSSPLKAGDVWIIVDAAGGDAHTGLCVADQADIGTLATVEGGQFDGHGSTAIGSFFRKLVKKPGDARFWMGNRYVYGVIRAEKLPIPVEIQPEIAMPAAGSGPDSPHV